MKKSFSLFFLFGLMLSVLAQAPYVFNYQTVIRNTEGQPLANQAVSIQLTLQSEDGNTQFYSETHNLTTSPQGVVSVAVGSGSGSVGNLAEIPWAAGGIYLQLEVDPTGGTSYALLGQTALLAVPYALYAHSATHITPDPIAGEEEPLFVVRNRAGQIVFAVYEGGVRAYVDDTSKQTRGGFAIGGLSDQNKEQEGLHYFSLSPDSVRIHFRTPAEGNKQTRGGFAIGGLSDQNKAQVATNLMYIAPDSARIYVDSKPLKQTRGGFAIGGLSDQNKGGASNFLFLTPENYFIGHEAGKSNLSGEFNTFFGFNSGLQNITGISNSFIGFRSGYSNLYGSNNIFMGNESGYSNIGGFNNSFIGDKSGYSNTNGYYNLFIGNEAGYSNTS